MVRLSLILTLLLNLAVGFSIPHEFSRDDFPPGFVFGSGTSAYQVEGAAREDGRTPRIWDTYAHDDGKGPSNPKGLQYYNNLIDELVNNGIQPHVTLSNYDLPQALEDEYGGWVSRRIVLSNSIKRDFTLYAEVCFREFGNMVLYWSAVNEPNVYVLGGFDMGFSPPQRCSPFGVNCCSRGNSSSEPYIAAHNILSAHASAARLYKTKYQDKQHGFIGLSIFGWWFVPLTDTKEDSLATQRALEFHIDWFLDPLVFGDYPNTMKQNVSSRLPAFTDDESKLVKGSFDFIGVIHYSIFHVRDDSKSLKMENRDVYMDAALELIEVQDTYNSSAFDYSRPADAKEFTSQG